MSLMYKKEVMFFVFVSKSRLVEIRLHVCLNLCSLCNLCMEKNVSYV